MQQTQRRISFTEMEKLHNQINKINHLMPVESQTEPETKADYIQRKFEDCKARHDLVYTNPDFARRVVEHFKPSGFCLDPCAGKGAFFTALPSPKDSCELENGTDFMDYTSKCDWIITNPPWSLGHYVPIFKHSLEIADNVVFLTRLDIAINTRQLKTANDSGFHLSEVILCDWKEAGFEQLGFGCALALSHWKRGSSGGDTRFNYWI